MIEQTESYNIIESLRRGTPPQRGVKHYSVGNERLIDGVRQRHLSGIGERGTIRFVCGSWGAGKTHFFRLLQDVAFEENCLVSNVELNKDSVALNKFEKVLAEIISKVRTPEHFAREGSSNIAPFGIVLQEALYFLGTGSRELADQVPHTTYSKASEVVMSNHGMDIDFKKVIVRYWETFLPESPDRAVVDQTRGELLQWFSGEGTIGNYRKRFGVSKMVTKENAKMLLQSLSEFVRLCGYRGLVILFDEAEQAYSLLRKSSLKDAHNNLLSLINNVENLKGLFLIYATTLDFYNDTKHGIVIYGALLSRIGQPEQRPPRALDVVWNLDEAETKLEDYQQAAVKIRDIYAKAFPEAANKLPPNGQIERMVSKLHGEHSTYEKSRFWRVLVTVMTRHFDDCQDGIVRTVEDLRTDVMASLKEA